MQSNSTTADGRFTLFASWANEIVDGDNDHAWDVFVHDRVSGRVELVSEGPDGGALAAPLGALSGSGDLAVFEGFGFRPDGGAEPSRLYLRQLPEGPTQVLPLPEGRLLVDNFSVSADGSVVGFITETPAEDYRTDAWIYDVDRGKTRQVTSYVMPAGAERPVCRTPLVSGDGSTLTFTCSGRGITRDDTTDSHDVFVASTAGGPPRLVSRGASGGAAAGDSVATQLSADGQTILFGSNAPDLAADATADWNYYVHDRRTETTTLINRDTNGMLRPGGRPVMDSVGTTVVLMIDRSSSDWGLVIYDVLTRSWRAPRFPGRHLPHALSPRGEQLLFTSSASLDSADHDSSADAYIADLSQGDRVRLVCCDSDRPISVDAATFNRDSSLVTFSAEGEGLEAIYGTRERTVFQWVVKTKLTAPLAPHVPPSLQPLIDHVPL